MKSILLKSFGQTISATLLLSLAACNLPQTTASQGSAKEKASTNLVALLFVKKDNLKNELRGEIYPIALLLNDRYVEIGTDLTRDLRDFGTLDAAGRDRILSINNQRIVTNAIQKTNPLYLALLVLDSYSDRRIPFRFARRRQPRIPNT